MISPAPLPSRSGVKFLAAPKPAVVPVALAARQPPWVIPPSHGGSAPPIGLRRRVPPSAKVALPVGETLGRCARRVPQPSGFSSCSWRGGTSPPRARSGTRRGRRGGATTRRPSAACAGKRPEEPTRWLCGRRTPCLPEGRRHTGRIGRSRLAPPEAARAAPGGLRGGPRSSRRAPTCRGLRQMLRLSLRQGPPRAPRAVNDRPGLRLVQEAL